MFPSDPRDALVLAHDRVRTLREESARSHLLRVPGRRRALATSLRRAANLLDPLPLTHRPA